MLCYGVKPSFFCRGGSQKGGGGLPKQVNIKTTALAEEITEHSRTLLLIVFNKGLSLVEIANYFLNTEAPIDRPMKSDGIAGEQYTSWP